jgi:hypothetical protein
MVPCCVVLCRRWYFEQLEREQEYLELEVKLEANQHWNTVRSILSGPPVCASV